jgi:hypothetical protein
VATRIGLGLRGLAFAEYTDVADDIEAGLVVRGPKIDNVLPGGMVIAAASSARPLRCLEGEVRRTQGGLTQSRKGAKGSLTPATYPDRNGTKDLLFQQSARAGESVTGQLHSTNATPDVPP